MTGNTSRFERDFADVMLAVLCLSVRLVAFSTVEDVSAIACTLWSRARADDTEAILLFRSSPNLTLAAARNKSCR